MTIGTRASSSPSSRRKAPARPCASAVREEHQQHRQTAQENEALVAPNRTPSRGIRSSSGSITRQVSHDGLSEKPVGKMRAASASGRASPIRCVSEFDKASSLEPKHPESNILENSARENCAPSLPNPLHNRSMLEHHTKALRLEAQLHPMLLILSRLMAHLTFNRHGIFNSPVDPVALSLPDYFTIIKEPMDLGTVRKRLHSYEYNTRRECAEDIRLCLRNAMTYNPPNNVVHSSAKDLLAFFEDQVKSFCPELAASEDEKLCISCAPSLSDKLEKVVETVPSTAAPSLCSSVCAPTHAPGTRKSASGDLLNPPTATMLSRKRRKRGSKVCKEHNCQWCNGSTCVICEQGCLSLEPTLLSCYGPQCSGAKIRKGATYYISPDGSFQFCHRCHAGLSAILPHAADKLEDESICRYKRDLLKRKNDEEVVESWVQCSRCQSSVHQFCAIYNSYVHPAENYLCPYCVGADNAGKDTPLEARSKGSDANAFTFVSGSEFPVALSYIADLRSEDVLGAASLPETSLSVFIEEKVKDRLGLSGIPNADKTVLVRVISDCDRRFKVPEVVRNHFEMRSSRDSNEGIIAPPSIVKYRSKAITLFQKIDGLDVCIFCMYVHEYDGDQDEFDDESDKVHVSQQKRVYIAYLDSVEYFRPRSSRTEVYHEVLSAYLATARKRGFETAHIWACPPLRGNSFVFWNHPAAQRTPNIERLTAWYHGALSRAIDCGIVADVKSLYESDFQDCMEQIDADEAFGANPSFSKIPCPPLLDGDFWVEEAVRLHGVANGRLSRDYVCCDNVALSSPNSDGAIDPCPAVQVSTMLLDKIIALPSALAFRRPVNAAALKLKDYHSIITKPMDLGTVHSRCALGEYRTLAELVADVNLVFANAKKYNPIGHTVHQNAVELSAIFETELNEITKDWGEPVAVQKKSSHSWRDFADMSLSLNVSLDHLEGLALVEVPPPTAAPDSLATMVSAVSESVSAPRTNDGVIGVHKTSTAAALEKRMADLRAGPKAVLQRMVGSDNWLLDKNPSPPKDPKKFKRKKSGGDSLDEPAPKRRRQSWLGEEVGNSVRRVRTSLFQCSLTPESSTTDLSNSQLQAFSEYTKSYNATDESSSRPRSSPAADARHGLLEFSQFRNLEFDTLRRAKYSSAILLYHLHNRDAPGLIPECTSCCRPIDGIRWHKMMRVVERQRRAPKTASGKGRKPSSASIQPFVAEELCCACYSEHKHPNEFIPLQVSIQKQK